MRYANEKWRNCHSILNNIIIDYKKQVFITDIKMNQQCFICHVPFNKQENLSWKWLMRTHENTQKKIQRQRMKNTFINDLSYVHSKKNFAWMHYKTNIHVMMMMNILHQLHKKIMMNLILWIVTLLIDFYSKKKKRRERTDKRKIKKAFKKTFLDHKFQHVSSHQNLKIFKHFNAVNQWTEIKQKTLNRQLIGVIASLLTKTKFNVMKCVRTFLNFIMLTFYKSQNENILKYITKALRRVNKLKIKFIDFRPVFKKIEKSHFNFFKFHVMNHYIKFIRLYDSVDQFDISHMKATHKYLMKIFYQRTNKNENY